MVATDAAPATATGQPAASGGSAAASVAQPDPRRPEGSPSIATGNTGTAAPSTVDNTSGDVAVFASQRETQPAVQRAGSSEAETPAPTQATAAVTQAQATEPAKEVTQPVDETVTLTKRELESQIESRLQKGLVSAQKRWERDRQTRQDREAAERVQQAEQARERELYEKSLAGEYQADEELLNRTKASLATKFGKQAISEEVSRAQNEERQRIWDTHLKTFGVEIDPDDDEMVEATTGSDFAALNAALLKRASTPALVEAAKANPAIRSWHDGEIARLEKEHAAALAAAREAGFTNGQVQTIRSGDLSRPDLSPSAGGRGEPTLDDLERLYATNPRDREVAKAYRERVIQRRG